MTQLSLAGSACDCAACRREGSLAGSYVLRSSDSGFVLIDASFAEVPEEVIVSDLLCGGAPQ